MKKCREVDDKVRSWRRRALLKRGARMHSAMGPDAKDYSLAMLDETGVVVSWYGRADGNDHAADHVVDRHVSQFYVADDIASRQPLRDLHAATVEGSSTRRGWRRQADGTAFWGTTVIDAVVLRDGRLQGFSYLTNSSAGPWEKVSLAQSAYPRQNGSNDDLPTGIRELGFLPTRDRMAASRSAARQRRLFRLACRLRALEREPLDSSASRSQYGGGRDR
jgi:hypothetical protein